jgi:hypothetical protein
MVGRVYNRGVENIQCFSTMTEHYQFTMTLGVEGNESVAEIYGEGLPEEGADERSPLHNRLTGTSREKLLKLCEEWITEQDGEMPAFLETDC